MRGGGQETSLSGILLPVVGIIRTWRPPNSFSKESSWGGWQSVLTALHRVLRITSQLLIIPYKALHNTLCLNGWPCLPLPLCSSNALLQPHCCTLTKLCSLSFLGLGTYYSLFPETSSSSPFRKWNSPPHSGFSSDITSSACPHTSLRSGVTASQNSELAGLTMEYFVH